MRSLASRLIKLERIEAKVVRKPVVLVMGPLKRLPRDYTGEKHVVELNRRPSSTFPNSFDADFEERPGPGPRNRERTGKEIHLHFVPAPEPPVTRIL